MSPSTAPSVLHASTALTASTASIYTVGNGFEPASADDERSCSRAQSQPSDAPAVVASGRYARAWMDIRRVQEAAGLHGGLGPSRG